VQKIFTLHKPNTANVIFKGSRRCKGPGGQGADRGLSKFGFLNGGSMSTVLHRPFWKRRGLDLDAWRSRYGVKLGVLQFEPSARPRLTIRPWASGDITRIHAHFAATANTSPYSHRSNLNIRLDNGA